MIPRYNTTGMAYSQEFRRLAAAAAVRATSDLSNDGYAKYKCRDGRTLTWTPHASEAVILAAVALEAGINEMASMVHRGFFESVQPIPGDFADRPLLRKWRTFPVLIANAEWDAATRPWSDLEALVGLRNRLVHFEWFHDEVAAFMPHLLALDLAMPEHDAIYFIDAAMTDRVAHWAIETADAIFATHLVAIGRTGDELWWPWR